MGDKKGEADKSAINKVDKNKNNNMVWIPIDNLNPHLICGLCQGYLYEACTITECMHSFCKNCIVKHLLRSLNCPVCAIVIHPTDPFVHIRFDALLQDIVYVLLPAVKKSELEKEKKFYKDYKGQLDARGKELNSENQPPPPPVSVPIKTDSLTKRSFQRKEFVPPVSLSLQYLKADEEDSYSMPKHFIRVTGAATIKSVIKFLRLKLDLKDTYKIEFYCPGRSGFVYLNSSHTLRAVKSLYFHDKDMLPLKYDILEQDEL